MRLEGIKTGKSFMFAEIELLADKMNFKLEELGGNIIGKNFLVLENPYKKDELYSFILTDVNPAYIYTCIYANSKD